jgi:hypothetical protein
MSGDGARKPYGWAGTVQEFLQSSEPKMMSALEEHLQQLLMKRAAHSQLEAWAEEIQILRTGLRDAAIAREEVIHWGVVLEYELHLEGGRRPDALLLTGDAVICMEFKSSDRVNVADLDQAGAYARDLAEYHGGSHNLSVQGVLVPTRMMGPGSELDGVLVRPPDSLSELFATAPGQRSVALTDWVDADYQPIPSLVEAARMIFRHEGLPRIRRCESTGVPEAVTALREVIEKCASESGRALAFLAGVPGAGKTLAGLQLVYETSDGLAPAVFLSGNGPLVEVLRDALQSKTFVKDLHAFIKTYSQTTRKPVTNIIVFDEAQRAWDAGYMEHKKGIPASEPQLLVRIGEEIPNWCTLIGLVGDGQEIHAGEESGMQQWAQAIRSGSQDRWKVYCPPRMVPDFQGLDVQQDGRLDLTVTLRSRRAEKLHEWVATLLAGDLRQAARLAQQVRATAFPLYVTRDLEEAEDYVRTRYEGDTEARYGIIASSRTQGFLPRFGVDTSWPATKKVKVASWYNHAAGEAGAGGNFQDVVTEFGSQGLELDMPIVAWGDDLLWAGSEWSAKKTRGRYPLRDPEQLRINTYRVLLTRGRDGLVVYLPESEKLDSTETALLAAGLQPLPERLEVAI